MDHQNMLAQSTQSPAFRGPLLFLSNMYPAQVFGYPSVEHAYVAAKTLIPTERTQIKRAVRSSEVKRLGHLLKLRPDWDNIKLGVMETLLREKFTKHESLRSRLLETGEIVLVEHNYRHDTFWGVCKGVGTNHLGRLLMEIRTELALPPEVSGGSVGPNAVPL